jgi:hypothetical protein
LETLHAINASAAILFSIFSTGEKSSVGRGILPEADPLKTGLLRNQSASSERRSLRRARCSITHRLPREKRSLHGSGPEGRMARVYSCDEVLAELGNYLADELAREVRTQLTLQLSHCKTCQVIYDSALKTLKIVTDSDSFELPEDVAEPLVASSCPGFVRSPRERENIRVPTTQFSLRFFPSNVLSVSSSRPPTPCFGRSLLFRNFHAWMVGSPRVY